MAIPESHDTGFRFIGDLPREAWPSAWEVLFSDRSLEAETSLKGAVGAWPEPHLDACTAILTVLQDGRIVGVAPAVRQPGRIALCWPPRGPCSESLLLGLLKELLDALRREGMQIVQAFPDSPGFADQKLLAAAGFEHVADLLYLACCQFPDTAPESVALLEPYSAENHQRLLDVLDRTYEGSLDCPRLNGVRAATDVLATYRGSGEFDPRRWLIATRKGQDVGCLLLADHPQDDQWELVYLGLAPAARGLGLGRYLVRQAQCLTRQAHRRRLVLSVDANNAPAIGLYASEGFIAWDRREIYLRIFADSRTGL